VGGRLAAETRPPDVAARDRVPVVSVIVPAHDAASTLVACLEALLDQDYPDGAFEVIVVDDGSADDTAAVAARYPVRVIRQAHAGAGAARNRGARAALGAVLLFTDADCRPQPGWLAAMAAPFDDPAVAGVKGLFRSDQGALVARVAQAEYEEKEAQMLSRARVTFADTASAGYRASVFAEAGGFRTDLATVEDTELAFRVAASDRRIVVAPAAVVLHRHPETLAGYARRKFRYGFWGAVAYTSFPERVVDDSRTPAAMRWQLVLAPLLALSLVGSAVDRRLGRLAVALAGLFLASTAPFAWRERRHPAVALAAGPLFLVRALAISAGLAVGTARLALRRARR
jgi:glycosyltransferase involved in cell wall biosynthesis